MKKNSKDNKKSDDDLETLIEKGFKTYHAPPPTKPRCFNVLIGATAFLLWLLVMAIIMIIRSNETTPLPKEHAAVKSFIEKASTTNLGTIANDIVKPVIDNKTYRGLHLPNGMKIMMISDPDSLQASAAVNVKVGSFADPAEMGGLAHFCEHMVFMESKKYPELNGFQNFVSNYDGDTNAFTKPEDTNYYFQTTSSGFEEALSRFSEFFIDPIFNEDLMKQEVSSIDGELSKNLNDDGWRLRFLLQIASNPESALSKFTTGNTESLMTAPTKKGVNVVQELQNFFDKHYSANLMSLVVNYNKPIDEIETLVRKVFSNVPNKNSEAPSYEKDPGPFSGKYANKLIQYSPVSPSDSLQLIFSVKPGSDHPSLEAYTYINRILSDKDKGSLIKYMEGEELANSIIAGTVLTSSKFDIFLIEVGLTEKGLQNIPEVTKTVFSYLDRIAKEGITEDLYNQYAQINNYTFNYIPNEEDAMEKLSSIALNLQDHPLKFGISGNQVSNKFDKELLTEYVRQLNADNLVMFVSSPDFTVSEDVTETSKLGLLEVQHKNKNSHKLKKASDKISFTDLNLFDSLYGIHYNVKDLPTALLEELKEVSYKDYPDLKIPDLNEFVPEKFDLVQKACSKGQLRCTQNYQADALQTAPKKIFEDEYMRVWHQLDRSTGTPMVIGDIVLYSDDVQKDVIAATLAGLRVEIIRSLLEDKLFEIGQSGNKVDISTSGFKIQAFEDVFLDLMSTILKQFRSFDFTEDQFDDAKSSLISRLYFGLAEAPYLNLIKYRSRLLLEYNFLESELFNVADLVTFTDFKELIPEVDASPTYSEVLFMGNILDSKAKNYAKQIISALDYTPSEHDQLVQNRVLNITGKNLVFRGYPPISNGDENYILNYYQSGIMNPEKMCYLNLLKNLMENEVYTYIRTEQQLCYIVQTFADRTKNVLGLNILVQSSILDPNQLDGHIEIALGRTDKKLKSLSNDEFDTLVESFKQSISDKSATLNEKAEGYLGHIVNQDYIFNLREQLLDYLPNVTKKGLLSYFKNLVKKPNKLSIQLYNDNFEELPTDTLPKEKQMSKTDAVIVSSSELLNMIDRYPTHIEFETS